MITAGGDPKFTETIHRMSRFRGVSRDTILQAYAILNRFPDWPAPWVFADKDGTINFEWEHDGFTYEMSVAPVVISK